MTLSTDTIENFTKLYPVDHIGPSWQRGEDGKFILPEKTIGWEAMGWTSEYLLNPNCDPDDPQPFRFTNEQARLILWWYAVDENGRFTFRQGVIQRLKGH